MDDRHGRKQSKTSKLFSILRRSSRSRSRTRPNTDHTPPPTAPASPPPNPSHPHLMTKSFFGLSISLPRKNAPTSRPESPANHDTLISRPHSPRRPRGSSLSSVEQRSPQSVLSPRANESFPPDGSRNHHHQPTTPPKRHTQHATPIPTITYTSPTPQRPGSGPPRIVTITRSRSIDSNHGWYQPMTMDAVAEERLSKGEVVAGDDTQLQKAKAKESNKPKGKERTPPEKVSLTNGLRAPNGVSRAVKERRHGSFDFERSGWSGTRASSILTSNLAGIGANRTRPENGHSNKDPKPQSPAPTSRNSSMHNLASGAATIPDYTSASSSHSLENSQSTHHTQASGGGHAKKKTGSSSWGHSAEKKSPTEHSHESSKTRKRRTPNDLRLLGTTLGTFDFEPAVPSPNSHMTTRSEIAAGSKPWTQKESRQRSLGASSTSSHGFKSGTKGRSLDLGLGLSWAPTKVREDALLPSFGRSLSTSSKGSTTKSPRKAMFVDEMGVTRSADSKVGREVNIMFKQALAKADYGEFRNFVHRFDANEIPVKGSRGIVCEIERLLDKSKNLSKADRQRLLHSFAQIVSQHE